MTPKNTTHVYLYFLVTGYNMNMGYEWFQLKGIFRGLEGLKYPVFHLERNSWPSEAENGCVWDQEVFIMEKSMVNVQLGSPDKIVSQLCDGNHSIRPC